MLACWTAAAAAAIAMAISPQTLQWESDYGKALESTREDARPLLVVIDKPGSEQEQVDPQLIESPSATDEGAELLEDYDRCRVDVSTDYGKRVAEVFHATEFPFVAIIDKTGSVILHKQSGDVSAEEWQSALAKHREGERTRYTTRKPVSNVMMESGFNYTSPSSSYYGPSDCPSCRRGF